MATIDDLGGAADSLGSVPLGGPNGWAAAVRDAVKAVEGFAGLQVLRGSTARSTSGPGETGQFVDVVFSPPFAGAPVVVAGLDSTAVDGIGATVSADMVTAAGFRLRRMNSAGDIRTFGAQWIAIGPRSTP